MKPFSVLGKSTLTGVLTLFGVALLLGISMPTLAAPGYTYELKFWSDRNPVGVQERLCDGQAINNRGDVAFRTIQNIGGSNHERIRVYVAPRGGAPVLIYDETTNGQSDPIPVPISCRQSRAAPGINDDGIVSIPAQWVEVDGNGDIVANNGTGHVLIEPGVGIIRSLRDIPNSTSTGRVNQSLQMAATGVDNNNNRIMILSDGVITQTAGSLPLSIGNFGSLVNLNAHGVTAAGGFFGSSPNRVIAVFRGTVGEPLSSKQLGPDSEWHTDYPTPGINDRGWVSFSSNFNLNVSIPNPRVVLISPPGPATAPGGDVFTVAEAQNTDFGNFSQSRGSSTLGTGINNFNRVSFVAQLDSDNSGLIYVGDASGDAARLAIGGTVDFPDGQSFVGGDFSNDVSGHGVNSLNDRGEIAVTAFGTLYDAGGSQIASSVNVLIVATPNAGLEPGNPIIPDPGDALPGGGWRFAQRCAPSVLQVTTVPASPRARCFVDPEIAVGYDFEMEENSVGAFISVLVPVPLAGGDAEFTVEFNGSSAPLVAGTAYTFPSANPVRAFRIIGIDQIEALDPNDATAFVAGLTFTDDITEDVAFTMVPIVNVVTVPLPIWAILMLGAMILGIKLRTQIR